MKINRTQDANSVPHWVIAGSHLDAIEKNSEMLRSGIERINATASQKVDEICLFRECSEIEKCASNGNSYYFNSTWSEKDLSHLKEFASVCGLDKDKMIGVDPTSVLKEASSEQMVKVANSEPQVSSMEVALKEALGDPFHIEERANMDHMTKSDWQTINAESKLKDVPKEAMIGGILPLRGGEDYRIANQPGLPSNQNSIADPEALDRLWSNEDESNGERLAREAKERLEQREVNHKAWENEKVAQMEADDFKAQGCVFPTEVGNVGSGISNSFMGAYSDADLKNLPEKTAGESLSEQNEVRKSSIQREAKVEEERKEWDRIKEAPSRMVSDIFTEQLKKNMGLK